MTLAVVFSAIGFAVVALVVLAAVLFVLAWVYFNLIEGRFGAILFRRSPRRLSLASWHQTRLVQKGESDDELLTDWPADDFPIGERPFYLSYQVGKRRLFIMAGRLGEHRSAVIKGKHPA